MTEVVKPRRAYHSPRRQQQAAATRRGIVEAAAKLFTDHGYPATTMEAVAEAAGVALKTVYLAFTTKSGLLRAVWDVLLKGDQNDAGIAERAWYREILAEPEPRQQVALTARNSRAVKERSYPILKVIRSATPVDPDAAALWRLIQTDFYENQHAIVEALDAKHALRPGLDVARATDILWTLNHPDLWLLLVEERGWTPQEWEDWFAAVVGDQLLGISPGTVQLGSATISIAPAGHSAAHSPQPLQ